MPRVQITLTDDQLHAVRDASARRGRPVAEIIRTAVEDWLARTDRNERWERALALAGIANSGLTDLAENHDVYLGEDYDS